MTLYAVCFSEDVQDDQSISVVEAESKEDALHHHFRKSMKANKIMREGILDLSTDGFFYKYFNGDLDKFEDEFSDEEDFISVMKTTIEAWNNAVEVKDDVIDKTLEWLTDEICVVVANYLIEIDEIENWSGPYVVVEVTEIPTV